MVSLTKCVMLLAFFLGLVLNVAGNPVKGEICQCPGEMEECGDGVCEGDGIVCSYLWSDDGVRSDKQYCVDG